MLIFFCLYSPQTLYILENILEYWEYISPRGRSTEAKNRSRVEVCAPKTLRNVQNLKFRSASTQHLLLRGKRTVPRSSNKDRSRRRDCNVENIQEYLETRSRSTKLQGQGLKKARIFLRKKPAGASIFSRIFSNTKVRRTAYILKEIREWGI